VADSERATGGVSNAANPAGFVLDELGVSTDDVACLFGVFTGDVA
jgi:hypothetical protein